MILRLLYLYYGMPEGKNIFKIPIKLMFCQNSLFMIL